MTTTSDSSAKTPEPGTADTDLAAIATLLRKRGVALGLLNPADRHRALALAWRCLPQPAALNERQVNLALGSFLEQAGQFLRTDHVELRRWLVDGGWLSRDGFGREYRSVAIEQLLPACRHAALPLAGLDVNGWAQGVRELACDEAQRRRSAWEAQRRDAPTDPSRPAPASA